MQENQDTIFQDIPELKWVESREEGTEREVKSYVLRSSYLRTYQVEAVKNYYAAYGLPYEKRILDWKQVFGNDKPVVIEIGFGMGADGSVAGFHIFFPDPWPKKRQQKRRLIQLPFASLLASKLTEGGYIYCVTDWEEYAYQMLDVFGSTEGLLNPYEGFCPPVTWRDTTKFEQKGLDKNHPINEVWFEKR
jgi:tRNA (guanine-N7-)-methyltransferase